jgi:Lon protease-like protein
MGAAYGYRKPSDMPALIPVFPLTGAILFPRGEMPLNIFEPRYLNMIDDALAGSRLIGIIQPNGAGPRTTPELTKIGCVGRLTSFSETDDGRYLITLTGISRFQIVRELMTKTPYRQVEANWELFADDLDGPTNIIGFDRTSLMDALKAYLSRNDMRADWSSIEKAPPETLVNALSVLCPFSAMEKQALLEAPSLDARVEALITLMEFSTAGDQDDDDQRPLQ